MSFQADIEGAARVKQVSREMAIEVQDEPAMERIGSK
jgi:hypothetical protein